MFDATVLSAVAPVAFTLFAWWFGTGVILYLDGLPRRTHPYTMAGATVLAGFGFWGLAATAGQATPASAYCAFACAMLVWAWQEVAFLLGYVTGSRRTACPPGAHGWRRARLAFEAVWHHEAALLVLGTGVLLTTVGQPNRTGLWTFVVLWLMRQGAKLNVFFGVRNLSEEFLPPHLAYLQTYFTRKPFNAFWPIGVAAAVVAAVPLWQQSASAQVGSYAYASSTVVFSLLALGIVEHAFLVLPIPFGRLWDWAMRSHAASAAGMPLAGAPHDAQSPPDPRPRRTAGGPAPRVRARTREV